MKGEPVARFAAVLSRTVGVVKVRTVGLMGVVLHSQGVVGQPKCGLAWVHGWLGGALMLSLALRRLNRRVQKHRRGGLG